MDCAGIAEFGRIPGAKANPVVRFCLAATVAIWAMPVAAQDQPCTEIRFAPGTFGTEITGVAPANGAVCYTLGTGAGQTATLRLVYGRNTIFSVIGLADARDALSFPTEARDYRILVTQLMRSVTDEPFRLAVEVTGQPRATGEVGKPHSWSPGDWRGVEAGITGSASAVAADGSTRVNFFCRKGGPQRATMQLLDYPGGLLPHEDGETSEVVLKVTAGQSVRRDEVVLLRHQGNDEWWDAVDAVDGPLLDAIAAGRAMRLVDADGSEIATFGLSGSARARGAIRRQCGF